jgi:serine/threonine-protein kinase
MGRVFVAQKDGSLEICVLKLLNTEHENDQAGAQRLRREAHLLALMNHPHISRVLDAGFERGAFFLALEYIPGHTISTIQQTLRKQHRRIPPEVAMVVGLDVLSGLEYAHDHQDPDGNPIHLVHRDLSPNNIMLSYRGEAKIIDFGIASGKIDTFKTKPGHIVGTPRYLSPEQATMKPIDRRSDIYTLAVVLYGMFSGRPLIKKGAPGQVLAEIVDKIPRALTEIVTDFPESIWKVIEVGLHKDPAQRWQSAREFREALAGSHPWTLPTRQEVGLFLEEYFPEGKKVADNLMARGRANAPAIIEGGGFYDTTGIDHPLPQRVPITEPEITPDAPAGDAPTDLITFPPSEELKTAEVVGAEPGEQSLERELATVRAKNLDTGPTVANDPRQFSPGLIEEKKRVPTPRQATDPSGPAARSGLWMWIVLLVVSIVLGIGAGVVFNNLGQ